MTCFDYNIHDIIKFKILIKDRFFLRSYFHRFKHEFEYFKTDHVDSPDFIVEVGPFTPDTKNSYSLEEDQFHVKENYLHTKDSYKTAKWEVEVSDLDKTPIMVKVNPNFSGYLFFGSYIINFLLRVLINKKGYPLIHASGITKNNKAFIFPARSGSGKTVITMHFLDNGFNLLGDNFIIASQNKVLSFPSSMNIFYYNLVPKIKRALSKQALFVLKLKYILYKVTFGYVKIFTPVNTKLLFGNKVCDESPIDTVCLMQVGEKFKVDKISKDELVQKMVINNQMDAYPFIYYINEFAFIYPDHWLSNHWDTLKNNYDTFLSNVNNCYKVTLPRKISADTLEHLGELIH